MADILRFIVLTFIVALVGGSWASADVPVTDDIPDLTAAQTRDLERRAEAGDSEAAIELSWRIGPERHALRYLLMAADRGDCDAMARASEYYGERSKWQGVNRWIGSCEKSGCGDATGLRENAYFVRHRKLLEAAMSGDCESVRVVRKAIEQLGDRRSPWFTHQPDRHGC